MRGKPVRNCNICAIYARKLSSFDPIYAKIDGAERRKPAKSLLSGVFCSHKRNKKAQKRLAAAIAYKFPDTRSEGRI